jgi:prolyl-tRNA synthetase
MLQEYQNLCTEFLAIPVVTGRKSESEKFPGAVFTLTFEGLMQDGKALQMGTSHLLSQSFAHVFDMKFQDRQEKQSYPYLTSWGTTTRLIGALVMTHGDQKGLVLPPKIAPIQVVIIPIFKSGCDNSAIIAAAKIIEQDLKKEGIRIFIDEQEDKSPGSKFFKWELKGVPIRIELGPKDIEKNQAVVVERIEAAKRFISLSEIKTEVISLLSTMQTVLFERAQARMHHLKHTSDNLAEFGPLLEEKGNFYQTSWCGNAACETELKNYKASIREENHKILSEFFHNKLSS